MTHNAKHNDCDPQRGLSVSLRQSHPVSLNIDFQCKAGELLALIGPSGSGKSTVLRSIAGLHTVDQGLVSCGQDIWLDTTNSLNMRTQARKVGLVFQHYGLFPHKSALDNVALAVQGKSRTESRKLAHSWLERTNMTGLEERKPDALSGGQKQRVALARALARDPLCLLLDEPFSAVDQQTRRRLYRELATLRSSLAIPIILVTHDIHEVQQLADSLCLIHKGRTLQYGPVQQVINAPKDKSVARLLGHQNLLNATVSEHTNDGTRYSLGSNESLLGPKTETPIGKSVTLLIAPTSISLQTDDNNIDHSPNKLHGSIRDAVGLGDEWSVRVHLNNVSKSLRFRLPLHRQSPHSIAAGVPVCVNILISGVHAISSAEESYESDSITT